MEPRKAIPKKDFVLEEEINLIVHYRISNTNWCKCKHECKPVTTFAENFCLLFRLKSWSVREASSHSAFMDNYPTISHKFQSYLRFICVLFVSGVAEQNENAG